MKKRQDQRHCVQKVKMTGLFSLKSRGTIIALKKNPGDYNTSCKHPSSSKVNEKKLEALCRNR